MNKRLVAILADVFGLKESEVHAGVKKSDVGTWDSLKQMDLVLSLEREYGISLEITDIVGMVSVGAICQVLAAKGVDIAG